MKRIAFGLALVVLFTLKDASAAGTETHFDHRDAEKFYFKNADQIMVLKTEIPDPDFITLIPTATGKSEYVLYQGRSCATCPIEPKSLYLQKLPSSKNETPEFRQKPTQLIFPGKIYDPKKGQLVYEARAFYGNCIPRFSSAYVVHQKEVIDKKRGMQKSVLVLNLTDQGVDEQLLERHLPALENSIRQVKKKICFEIPGKNRQVLKHPLDLSPKKGLDDDEEDDDQDDAKDANLARL